jgi:GNAT superfamily N-acetyltransferase
MESTDPSVLIRAATADDTAALAELVTHLGYPTGEEAMRRRLDAILPRDDYATFVAERGGRVVAFVGVMHGLSYNDDAPYGRVLVMVVEPEERGKGTGAVLLAEAERWARAHGAEKVHLTTALHRGGAHRFYERLGYERTGARYLKKLA